MQDFDAQQAERYATEGTTDREELAFQLGGRTLYASPHVPAGVIVLLGRIAGGGNAAQDSNALTDALRMMLEADSQDAFEDAIMGKPIFREVVEGTESKVTIVQVTPPDVDTLFAVVEWLTEKISGRPFGQQSNSAQQSQTPGSGISSRGGRLQTVVPRSASGSGGAS